MCEASPGLDPLTVADAAERGCQKLLDRLARLITPSGCHALLARALYLAQADFTFLRGIESRAEADTYVEGLSQRVAGADPGQVHRGLAALLGTLIELVALFIGEYLTGRMLREVWPDMPALEPTYQPASTSD
jgi:hypothetical protein